MQVPVVGRSLAAACRPGSSVRRCRMLAGCQVLLGRPPAPLQHTAAHSHPSPARPTHSLPSVAMVTSSLRSSG